MKPSRSTRRRKLTAEWVVGERDLTQAVKLVPGADVNLLRWPVAASIAYAGVAAHQIGLILATASALAVGAFWIGMLVVLRTRMIRKQARLPEDQRRVRLAVDGETLRYEDASGHAHERPIGDVSGVATASEGALLRIRNQVLFVPDRAFGGSLDAWQELLRSVPAWTQPIGAGFTYALWAFATAVAVYAQVRSP
jgi:hypothetical protein